MRAFRFRAGASMLSVAAKLGKDGAIEHIWGQQNARATPQKCGSRNSLGRACHSISKARHRTCDPEADASAFVPRMGRLGWHADVPRRSRRTAQSENSLALEHTTVKSGFGRMPLVLAFHLRTCDPVFDHGAAGLAEIATSSGLGARCKWELATRVRGDEVCAKLGR
jgi:hypothetical protein